MKVLDSIEQNKAKSFAVFRQFNPIGEWALIHHCFLPTWYTAMGGFSTRREYRIRYISFVLALGILIGCYWLAVDFCRFAICMASTLKEKGPTCRNVIQVLHVLGARNPVSPTSYHDPGNFLLMSFHSFFHFSDATEKRYGQHCSGSPPRKI